MSDIVIVYLVLVLATVFLHELLHFMAARALGYCSKLIVCRKGIGLNIPGVYRRSHALAILLAPQALTVAYLVAASLVGGVWQIILFLLALINFGSSFYDFKEAGAFIMSGWGR